MIRRPEVFDEEYVPPDDLLHRHTEVQQLSDALAPLAEGERGRSSLVFGPSGVGKTTTVRYVLDLLQDEATVRSVYVNCWETRSTRDVAEALLEAVGGQTHDVHPTTSADAIVRRFRETIDAPLVVVLDEVDQLHEERLLYDLHGIGAVTFVGIANDEDELLAFVDDRIRSRLSKTLRLKMDSYSVDELRQILQARIRAGLAPDAVPEHVVREIADEAGGDARAGINYLYAAAQAAERDGRDQITVDCLPDAVADARHQRRAEILDRFDEHLTAIDEAVHAVGEGSLTSDIYPAYSQRVEDPLHERTVRRKIKKVADYDPFVEADGETRARVYRSSL